MYVIIWKFQPKRGFEKEFEEAYNAKGAWAQFFKNDKGYIRTELLHDNNDHDRYLTIDYWTSQEAYEAFRKQHADEYKAIDLKCESLTAHEAHVGSFTTM